MMDVLVLLGSAVSVMGMSEPERRNSANAVGGRAACALPDELDAIANPTVIIRDVQAEIE
eukprot:CAMPEP_0174335506 /NCGR_PEP_ID=MMETSP0810-20121108/20839_1 /TAXON_ID=73025 ORGANISM="Eutreptiella gymnastica-like, Strain CCMP1594" /NCGR_SAMPLE_ID=MMETSP0810 /ASSEMBLY_ACC=CAM_ASM_000659 /LENGTH=59 /DNA_ID=CAMNT_0015453929 /DNA_START=41 /DNA_END=216 /DNA_ORIENTATION=+